MPASLQPCVLVSATGPPPSSRPGIPSRPRAVSPAGLVPPPVLPQARGGLSKGFHRFVGIPACRKCTCSAANAPPEGPDTPARVAGAPRGRTALGPGAATRGRGPRGPGDQLEPRQALGKPHTIGAPRPSVLGSGASGQDFLVQTSSGQASLARVPRVKPPASSPRSRPLPGAPLSLRSAGVDPPRLGAFASGVSRARRQAIDCRHHSRPVCRSHRVSGRLRCRRQEDHLGQEVDEEGRQGREEAVSFRQRLPEGRMYSCPSRAERKPMRRAEAPSPRLAVAADKKDEDKKKKGRNGAIARPRQGRPCLFCFLLFLFLLLR